jgi:putative sigma-54 modulation protein
MDLISDNQRKSIRRTIFPGHAALPTRRQEPSNVFPLTPAANAGAGRERSLKMQINLSGHHVDISEPLREYVTSKLSKLERHFDHVTNAHVVLTVEKQVQKAEAAVHVSGGRLFADATGQDMYAAIDAMTDKLDRQIRRHKEKLTDHRRSEGGLRAFQEE